MVEAGWDDRREGRYEKGRGGGGLGVKGRGVEGEVEPPASFSGIGCCWPVRGSSSSPVPPDHLWHLTLPPPRPITYSRGVQSDGIHPIPLTDGARSTCTFPRKL